MAELVQRIRAISKQRPPSLAATLKLIEPLTEELRILIGNEISPILNGFQGEKVGTLDEKRAVARQLNDLLDNLGLRIKCPNTGLPSSLVGQTRSDGIAEGRFQLQVSGRVTRTFSSATLPTIELMPRSGKEQGRER